MRVSSILKIALAVALLLLIGLIGAAKALDSASYQAFLAERVRGATGLDLSFTGPTKIKLGLSPRVSFTGLTLAERKGAPALLYIDRVEAKVALLPLVMRVVQVEHLLLQRPILRLIPMARPHGPPDFTDGAERAPPTLFSLREIQVEDGRVLWRDSVGGEDHSLVVAKARVRPESPAGGPLNLRAEGPGDSFVLDGVIGSLSTLLSAKPYPVQMKGSVSGAVVVARGQMAEPLAGKGVDLDLRAQGDELADLLRRLGLAPRDHAMTSIGPYKLSGHLSDAGLSDVDAVFGRKDRLLVGLKGGVRTPLPAPSGVDLVVTAESDSLSDLGRLIGAELPSGGPVKLSGHLNDIEDGWRMTGLKSQVGHSDFAGELALVRSSRPRFYGRLSSAQLVAGDFGFAHLTEGPNGSMPSRPSIPVRDGRILPLDPLPFDLLKAADLSLSLTASRFQVGPLHLSDLSAGVSLVGGKLMLEDVQARMGEGTLKGEGRLDASSARTIPISVKLVGSGLDLTRLGLAGLGGRGDLSLDLRTAGTSLRTLASGLDGSLSLAVSDLTLNAAETGMGERILSALVQGVGIPPAFACAQLRLPVRNGVISADSRVLALDLGRGVASAAGVVDLRAETVDLALAVKGGGWARLKGMLSAPELSTDGPAVRLTGEPPACRAVQKRR